MDISTDNSDWVAALRYYHGMNPGSKRRWSPFRSRIFGSRPTMSRMIGLAAYGLIVVNMVGLTIVALMQRFG